LIPKDIVDAFNAQTTRRMRGKSITLEVISKPQIRLKSKAQTDEKAQHTR
jgi:hypothetical protein